MRKESPGVGNNLIVETLEYNAKGQLVRKSNPYLETVETPVFTVTEYHAADGYVTKVTHPDGSYSIPTYDRFDELMQSYAADGSLISSVKLIKNAKGQVLSRTTDGSGVMFFYPLEKI